MTRVTRQAAALLSCVLLAAACSGGDGTATSAAQLLPTDVVDAGDPADGMVFPIADAPTPDGYTVAEYLFGGEAAAYRTDTEPGPDGRWEVSVRDTAPYRTRMIVRRPPAERFSGVVLVEWLNVTAGTDGSIDWAYLSEEIAREGHAWVGVSVQAVGIDGAALDLTGGRRDTRGLVVRNPDRYGTLTHPGDAYAFDIFTQAGALIRGDGAASVMGALEPTHLIAVGESQSAGFLVSHVNAFASLTPVFDGYFVHSRGGFAPNPAGGGLGDTIAGTLIRTDGNVPVFQYETETDVSALGFSAARQDDSPTLVTWEVAGAAHADAFTLAADTGMEPDPSLGALIGCPPTINDGPHHETAQAALHHLVAWVLDGIPPPASPRIELDGVTVVRDDLGVAVGGVRTPVVDVPLRVLSGDPGPGGAFCFLFGQTIEIPPDVLGDRYGSVEEYEALLRTAALSAVSSGWLLPEDAETMITEETRRAEALLGG